MDANVVADDDDDDDDACAGLSNERKKARDANRIVNLRLILWRILCRGLGGWVVDDGNKNDDGCDGTMLEEGEHDFFP